MEYQAHVPRRELTPHVESLWTLTSGGSFAPDDAGTILPDVACEIVLSFGDPVRASRAPHAPVVVRMVVGQMERPWRLRYSGIVTRTRPSVQ